MSKSPWADMSYLLTTERRTKLHSTATKRTRKVILALQNVHDGHNIGACLRSAEAFGVLGVNIIDPNTHYRPSTVARGSQKWLDTKTWPTTASWVAAMRAQNICIAGGMGGAVEQLEDIPLDRPVALVFGNEQGGLDPEMEASVDFSFHIPMLGMVESLNISVAAAVALYVTTTRLQKHWGSDYFLNPKDRDNLLSHWVCRDLKLGEKTLAETSKET